MKTTVISRIRKRIGKDTLEVRNEKISTLVRHTNEKGSLKNLKRIRNSWFQPANLSQFLGVNFLNIATPISPNREKSSTALANFAISQREQSLTFLGRPIHTVLDNITEWTGHHHRAKE